VSATFTETSWFHDLSPFVSATFMTRVHDFPRGEVSVKVGVMEFGLNHTMAEISTVSLNKHTVRVSEQPLNGTSAHLMLYVYSATRVKSQEKASTQVETVSATSVAIH